MSRKCAARTQVTELAPLAMLPNFLLQWRVVAPMRRVAHTVTLPGPMCGCCSTTCPSQAGESTGGSPATTSAESARVTLTMPRRRMHVGGSMLAAGLALERGWAINLGGGMHHASADQGMG
jgi:acetoin utilization deacetylase AcuC-like enzyme